MAAAAGLALIVSERVSQEDEDKDDTESGKCRAGDVKKPGCLGIFDRSVHVVEEFLIPDLRQKEFGET